MIKEVPSYLIKLINEFEELISHFDCLAEKDSPFLEFQYAEFQMKNKALEIAFFLSCELEAYIQ